MNNLADEIDVRDVDIEDPSSCIASIAQEVSSWSDKKTLGIDISCFTKPSFYVLLNYFAYIRRNEILTFYTQPRAYRFPQGNYRSFRSSSGPIVVKEVPSFPGEDSREEERLLILLIGFDGDLSAEITETVAPTKTIVVNGFPSYQTKYKDISIICNERLIQPSNVLKYSSSLNPFETYNLLDQLVLASSPAAIDIAPLGNKPMALGACLFAIHNRKVRVVYPFPERYENVTTDECSDSWVYRIPLIDNV